MTYFSEFPNLAYEIDDTGNPQLVTDLLRRVKMKDYIKNNIVAYDEYDVSDGDTIFTISDEIYGDTRFYWVLMLINEYTNTLYDMPLTYLELLAYIDKKYGSGSRNTIHHYEDANEYIVLSTAPGATSITNLVYEEAENEKKRRIKVLKPNYLEQVVNEFKEIVKI